MTVVAVARALSVEAMRRGMWRPVVDPIDLHIDCGEIVGVAGESGAGKTLMTRALVGLLPRGTRANGTVILDGVQYDARTIGRQVLGRDATVVLQNPATALDPLSKVEKQLVEGVTRLGLMTRKQAAKRARELLSRLAFRVPDDVLGLYPHQLSGGMAQRVAIACALMPAPKLLIVDEPTSALDANVRVEVLHLVRELGRDLGTAVLLVSHDLAIVGRFCDRVLVMYAGRIVEHGPTAAILGEPQHPYTQALLNCAVTTAAQPRAMLPVIAGSPPAPEEWPSGCVFAPRCEHAWHQCLARRPAAVDVASGRDAACHLVARNDAAINGRQPIVGPGSPTGIGAHRRA